MKAKSGYPFVAGYDGGRRFHLGFGSHWDSPLHALKLRNYWRLLKRACPTRLRFSVVQMDTAFLFGDEPLIVLYNICSFLVFNFELYGLQRMHKGYFPFFLFLGHFLAVVRDCWRPSGKFVLGGQGVWQLSGKRTNPRKAQATFASCTYLLEGCQYPLILYQRVQSSSRRY